MHGIIHLCFSIIVLYPDVSLYIILQHTLCDIHVYYIHNIIYVTARALSELILLYHITKLLFNYGIVMNSYVMFTVLAISATYPGPSVCSSRADIHQPVRWGYSSRACTVSHIGGSAPTPMFP